MGLEESRFLRKRGETDTERYPETAMSSPTLHPPLQEVLQLFSSSQSWKYRRRDGAGILKAENRITMLLRVPGKCTCLLNLWLGDHTDALGWGALTAAGGGNELTGAILSQVFPRGGSSWGRNRVKGGIFFEDGRDLHAGWRNSEFFKG